MFSVALLLLLAAGSCKSLWICHSQHFFSCLLSLSSYYTAWIRQPAGKGLEWIGMAATGHTTYYKDSLKNKFSIETDSSSKTGDYKRTECAPEDTAVYYCARDTQ
uniref:Immunoglobulin V-set domain-containing protein n=1 Tax=Seriola dumerili TaxID=41447 RepID=A0A3B4UNV3_SERDU